MSTPESIPDRNAAHASLESAWAAMRFAVEPGRFCLVGFDEPPGPAELALLEDPPGQLIREGGETTVLARESHLEELTARHPQASVERDLVWIRFEAPMAWELVGFLARVSAALAEGGVPIGAVCGFSRDHLFVASEHLPRAEAILARLFPRTR